MKALGVAQLFALLLATGVIISCADRCRERERVPFHEIINAYCKPFKPGSWWVFGNSVGVRDSVYVTEYEENWKLDRGDRRRCYEVPITTVSLRTTSIGASGAVHLTYYVSQEGTETAAKFSSVLGEAGTSLAGFGYSTVDGLLSCSIISDTTAGSSQYVDALLATRAEADAMIPRLLLAKGIGIVGYMTQADTFNLITHHVP